jgi:hypothetical protein
MEGENERYSERAGGISTIEKGQKEGYLTYKQ